MAMYDPGKLYVDPILTSFSVGYEDQTLFGERLFPVTPVSTQSGRYRVYDRSSWVVFPSRREPGTVANEVRGGKWAEDNFFTVEHSLQAAVADEEDQELQSQGGLANVVFGGGLQLNPHADATELITGSILREHEQKVASAIRNTSNYAAGHTTTLAGATKWSDYTYVTPGEVTSIVSNPVADIRAAAWKVYKATGRWPNTMAVPIDMLGIIEEHPRVVARFTNFALTDPEAWKRLIAVPPPDNVFIVDSMVNTANNIDATENIVSLWGQDVWLGLVDPTPGQKTITFGKTFAQLYPDGSTKPTDRWREEERKSDLVRTSYKYDLKVISDTAGYLFKNAVAEIT
jgi:hypothetical protein